MREFCKQVLPLKNYKNQNLKFIHGDAFAIDPFKADVIILSNVLEHIEDRIIFLKRGQIGYFLKKIKE